jgi:hypothetical protein
MIKNNDYLLSEKNLFYELGNNISYLLYLFGKITEEDKIYKILSKDDFIIIRDKISVINDLLYSFYSESIVNVSENYTQDNLFQDVKNNISLYQKTFLKSKILLTDEERILFINLSYGIDLFIYIFELMCSQDNYRKILFKKDNSLEDKYNIIILLLDLLKKDLEIY